MSKILRKISVWILFFAAVVSLLLPCGCEDSGTSPAPLPSEYNNYLDELRYDQVSFKQTHNSYIQHRSDAQENWGGTGRCDSWRGITIEEQLNFHGAIPWHGGVAGIEMDLKVDGRSLDEAEWRWCVRHRRMYSGSLNHRFSKYLERLSDWSAANPNHDVITVMIELKWLGDKVDFDIEDNTDCCAYYGKVNDVRVGDCLPDNPHTRAEWYTYQAGFAEKFDSYLSKHFDRHLLFTPGDLMSWGSGSDLVSAASQGWPKLKELRGKFIFFISDSPQALTIPYGDVSPADRLCFWRGNGRVALPPSGNILFWQVNNSNPSNDEYIRQVAQHPALILRCWPGDHDTETNFARALANGVNIIGTDRATDHDWATVGTSRFCPQSTTYWGPGATRLTGINQCQTISPLAAANYGGRLYVVYDYNYVLKYFTYDGSTWGTVRDIQGGSRGKPALAVYQNKLCLVTLGPHNSTQIRWRTYTEANGWTAPEVIADSKRSPGMAVYGHDLYVLYTGLDGRTYYKTFDGTTWSEAVATPERDGDTPAVCAFDGRLYVFYRHGSNDLYMMVFDGSSWSNPRNISFLNSANTGDIPTAVAAGDWMHVIHRGSSGSDLWTFKVWKGGLISGQQKVLQGLTSKSVAAAQYGSKLYMIYRSSSNNDIYMQTMNCEN